MPPCRVAEADLARVDLLEQLQRLAAVLHQDVRRRSGALDLDVVEGLIVVVVPAGVALLVTDTLLIAIAARGGRREAWHTFFSPSKRPIATLEEEQTCRWRTAVVRLSASLVVPRRSAHPTTRFMGRRPDGDAAPPEREGENLRPAAVLRSSSGRSAKILIRGAYVLEITTTTTSTASKEGGLCRLFACSHTPPSAAALPPSSRLAVIRPCLVVQLGLGHGTRQVVARAEGEALLEARDVRGLPPVPRRTRAVLGTGAAVLVEDAPADRVLLRRRLEVPSKRTLGALQGGFAKGRLRAWQGEAEGKARGMAGRS